jgi:uncharacterized protein HemX
MTAVVVGGTTSMVMGSQQKKAAQQQQQAATQQQMADLEANQAALAQQQAALAQQAPQQAAGPAPNSLDEQLIQIQKLSAMKDQGLLTEAEFNAKKAQILGI